jgi:hypothetical protein
MDREALLDELEALAGVEHALIVEYLTVSCALGHDLDEADGGATSDRGRQAAAVAAQLAQNEMFHLSRLCRVLVDSGRIPALDRATSIPEPDGALLPLDPPDAAALEHLLARETALATAVDARYARLAPAVTTAPVVDGDLLDTLRGLVVDDGPTHAARYAALRDALGDPPPPGYLRATRRQAADAFEQRLLDAADRGYGLVIAALRESVAQSDPFAGGSFRQLAVSAMFHLDDLHRLLVQRGLLPAFTAP